MDTLDKEVRTRLYIIDSLVARSGKILTPKLINDLTQEILERMIEVQDVPLYKTRIEQ